MPGRMLSLIVESVSRNFSSNAIILLLLDCVLHFEFNNCCFDSGWFREIRPPLLTPDSSTHVHTTVCYGVEESHDVVVPQP